MAFEYQPIYVFENENSTGLDGVPLNALITFKSTGNLYQYIDTAGVLSTTTLEEAKVNNIKEYINLINFSKAMFYGGISTAPDSRFTLLSNSLTLTQPEIRVGTARRSLAGVNSGVNGLFFGGTLLSGYATNTTTLLSSIGTLVVTESNVGVSKTALASSPIETNKGLFYSGTAFNGTWTNNSNIALIITENALYQQESNIGTGRDELGGASAGVNGLFHGGSFSCSSTITLINNSLSLVQAESSAGILKKRNAGASFYTDNISSSVIFYGGIDARDTSTYSNIVSLFSINGNLLQTESPVGTKRELSAGANTGTNCLFYGIGIATLLSPSATLVTSEVTVTGTLTATKIYALAGASI